MWRIESLFSFGENLKSFSLYLFFKTLIMKVLLFMPDIDQSSGGTSTWLRTLAEELGQLVDLHIATYKTEHPLLIKNAKIHYFKSSLFNGLKNEWFYLLNLVQPDVVHINTCWLPVCSFLQKWTQQKKYKVMVSPHGMLEPWIINRNYWTKKLPAILLFQRSAIQKAELIHATAESEKANLQKLGWNSHIEVVVNGMDVQNIGLKNSWKKRKKILFLSRVHPKKGIEIFLEAITLAKANLGGYEIIIAGEGEESYVNVLKQKAEKTGISSIINFVGGVYGDDKWKYYQDSDFFVLPTYSENFGLVIAEALASGTPVITTQGTPWKDLEEYQCGNWIDLNVDNLVKTMEKFLSFISEDLETMGKNGRKLIEDRYGNREMALKMNNLYSKLVSDLI